MAGAPRGVGAFVRLDRLAEVAAGIKILGEREVLIGVPEEDADRKEGKATNAGLAYIHSNGASSAGIPPRPFLGPGVERAKDEILDELKAAGQAALDGRGPAAVERILGRAGQIAVSSAQNVIREGIPPPLKQSTVRKRRQRSAGSRYRRKAKTAADTTPLIDTGQMLRAITWVLRKVRRR